MYKYISEILETLAFILPFNFWLVFMCITAPAIIFTTKPEQETWLKISKWVFVVLLTYIFLNLSIHMQSDLDRNIYLECMSQQPNSMQDENCHHLINTSDGARMVFALFFGWLYLMPYIGFCEFLWRVIHRKALKAMNKRQWFSNITIGFSIIVSMLWVWIIVAAILKQLSN